MSGTPLRILIADRSDDDYSLLIRGLREDGFDPNWMKVRDVDAMTDVLHHRDWDIVICNYEREGTDGRRVLKVCRETGTRVPLILLSSNKGDKGKDEPTPEDNCYCIGKEELPKLVSAVATRHREREDIINPAKEQGTRRPPQQQIIDFLEEMEELYWEIDLKGNFTFFNPYLCTLLRYTREELEAANLRTLVDHDAAERFEKIVQNIHMTDNQVKCVEFELIQKDGTKCWVETSVAPLRDADGTIAGLLGIGRDISSRKNTETDILRSLKVESVGILAGGIAHDFNNLLSVILGYISIARTLIDPEEEAALMLKKAEKAGFQATELTKRLITFSRGDEPWRKLTLLAPLLKRAADFSLVGKAVRFSYFIPEDLWPVNIDEGQMWQVVRNLVMNAGEAMPDGGIITVAAQNIHIDEFSNLPLQEGFYVRWSVTDQGTGITPEHLPRIFDPYFTTKGMGPKQGMGLGLAICFSIVRKHGGFITVDSKPGEGTTFYVYLPALSTKAQQDAAAADDRLLRKHRILVMDDEEDIRDIFGKLLNHLGYEAEMAGEGHEAISKFRDAREADAPFSAVILDLTVKDGLGGRQTLKKLLQIDPDVKAVITTSYGDDPIVTGFRYFGFAAALVKPFTVQDLQDSLDALLAEKGVDDLPLFRQ
jgi:PAS domain S-box-containing protein